MYWLIFPVRIPYRKIFNFPHLLHPIWCLFQQPFGEKQGKSWILSQGQSLFDCRKKQGYSDRAQTCMGRTCELQTERPQPRFKLETFYCEATVCQMQNNHNQIKTIFHLCVKQYHDTNPEKVNYSYVYILPSENTLLLIKIKFITFAISCMSFWCHWTTSQKM